MFGTYVHLVGLFFVLIECYLYITRPSVFSRMLLLYETVGVYYTLLLLPLRGEGERCVLRGHVI